MVVPGYSQHSLEASQVRVDKVSELQSYRVFSSFLSFCAIHEGMKGEHFRPKGWMIKKTQTSCHLKYGLAKNV